MFPRLRRVVAAAAFAISTVATVGVMATGGAGAAPTPSALTAGGATGGLSSFETPACGTPTAGSSACNAVQLLSPSSHWSAGPWAKGHRSDGQSSPASAKAAPAPPSSGYFPADLESAYGLTGDIATMEPGPAAPTVAIVDAYDDPNAASDLSAYRSAMSGATDPNTELPDPVMPPLCSSTVTSGCVTFTKVNQTGGTTYPSANNGWAEEISLDLDTVSAVCPDCNIVLVEASSSSMANLAQAVTEAKTFGPAAITNSYGGTEASSETADNSIYSAGPATAITAATGDDGYGVEYPAASPDLTAVGGTSLTYTGSGAGLQWQAQTVWSDSGSGCSADEAMPSWQDDQGVYTQSSTCTRRQVADISADANPETGFAAYDSYRESGWLVFGGTSLSTQIVGATYAVASATGELRPSPQSLYVDAGTSSTAATPGLVPVTSGSNSGCGNYLCNAADHMPSGYDGPGGLGTPYGVGAFTGAGPAPAPNPSLSFSPTTETVAAGTAAGPVTVDLSQAPTSTLSISLSTTSATGGFATAATGPFDSTLTLSVQAGTTTSPAFYYQDSTPGGATVTAGASGYTNATMTVTVNGATTTGTMTVSVSAGSLSRRGSYEVPLTVSAHDATSGTALSGASTTLDVYSGTSCSGTVAASGTATTSSSGSVTFTFQTRTAATWCAVATVTASGYAEGTGRTTFST